MELIFNRPILSLTSSFTFFTTSSINKMVWPPWRSLIWSESGWKYRWVLPITIHFFSSSVLCITVAWNRKIEAMLWMKIIQWRYALKKVSRLLRGWGWGSIIPPQAPDLTPWMAIPMVLTCEDVALSFKRSRRGSLFFMASHNLWKHGLSFNSALRIHNWELTNL